MSQLEEFSLQNFINSQRNNLFNHNMEQKIIKMRTNYHWKRVNRFREICPGDILIAQPFHANTYLKRAVVMIIEKNRQGNTGVILNKLSTIRMNEALSDTPLTNHVYFSGPHDLNLISFIHKDQSINGCIPIAEDLYWGGEFKQVEEKLANREMRRNDIRFLAGFMEWDAGVLEQEVLKRQWWTSHINSEELLSIHPDQLWSRKLIQDGNLYGMMDMVDDPCMN